MMHQDGENPVFDGAFRVNSNNHHIEAGHRYRKIKHEEDPHVHTKDDTMVVWRDSDVRPADGQLELKRSEPSAGTCAADTSDFNRQYDLTSREFEPLEAVSNRSLFGRQAIDGGGGGPAGDLSATIGDTSGCPTSRKLALVGIATDCNYWEHFWTENTDKTHAAVEKNVIGMVNKASEVYESSLKISLALQNLAIQPQNCSGSGSQAAPWNVKCGSVNLGDRLSLFSKWRGQKTDTNAYWTLLTTCNTDATVGFAWRGQLCRQGSTPNGGNTNETISSTNVIALTSTEWQVFAHETGHTFGAVHDCVKSTCPGGADAQPCCPLSTGTCDAGGKFIMNPSTGADISVFSQCTIGNICSGLKGNVKSDCLSTNRNVKLYTGSSCGNGIVETGEDCDCGSTESCGNNSCCDPKTCKFTTGSVCDPSNEDCCTQQCKFAGSDKTCRASTGPCDPEEKCSGTSGLCPEDKHKDNGQSCGDGLECASGTCTSRDQQCKVSFGRMSSSPKSCGNECLMQCSNTDYNGGQCTYFNSYFIDGTSCSGGGQCKDGQCQGGSWWKTFTDWYQSHLSISIPVTIVVALLIITIISSCFCSCFRRRPQMRKPKPVSPGAGTPPNNGGWQAYGGEYAPTQHNMNNMTMSGPYGYYGQQENANHQGISNVPHPQAQSNSQFSQGQAYNNNFSQNYTNNNTTSDTNFSHNYNNNNNAYNMQDMNHAGNYSSQDHHYPPPPPPPTYGNATNARYA